MKIEIRHRITNTIIIEGEYESIKDCLVENRGSNLSGSNLYGSDLSGSNLRGSNLSGSDLSWSDLSGSNLSGSNLYGSNLYGSDLSGSNLSGSDLSWSDLRWSNLSGSDLSWSDLRWSNLRGSNLSGSKEYSQNHDVFTEIVKRQSVKIFTTSEWKCIAVISIHRICWATIQKQFGKTAMSVFKKLSKVGFDEWEKYYQGYLKGDKK